MPSKQSSWFNDSFLAVLITLMRYAWLWLWFELARGFLAPQHAGELLAPWQFIVLPLVAFGLTRFIAGETVVSDDSANQGNDTPAWSGRLVVALVGLAATIAVIWWQLYASLYSWWDITWLQRLGDMLIHWDINQGLPAAGVAIVVLIALWLNGLGDAVRSMTHDDIWSTLQTGIVALVLYLAIRSRSTTGLPADLLMQVLLLFGAGMIALAFSSLKITVGLDRALGMGQRRNSATPMLSRYWLISVTATVVVLLGIGLGIAALVAPEQMARLVDAIRFVANAVGRVIGAILLMVGYVLFLIAYYIALLLEPLIRRLFQALADSPLMELAAMPEQEYSLDELMTDSTAIPDAYRWMALALVAIAVVIILALAVRRLRTTAATEVDEVRESILTTDLLQEQLASLWDRWFGRRSGRNDPFLSLIGEQETRQRIRAAYQQLLATTAALGQRRRPGATPTEYGAELHLPIADAGPRLALLTAAYHHARYAPDSPTAEEAALAQQAWELLQQDLTTQQQTVGTGDEEKK